MTGTYEADAVVVGGGPAGMIAARDLARLGLQVALIDENERLGGQYYKQRSEAVIRNFGEHRPHGSQMVHDLTQSGVRIFTSSFVWGVDDASGVILAETPQGVTNFKTSGIVLATGARERSIPFPGWHLPGVMTAGCAMHLAATDCVKPGRRMVVGGSGPFLLPVACALLDIGVDVVEVFEVARPYQLSRTSLGLWRHPGPVIELAGYMRKLTVAGVRIRQGHRIIAARVDSKSGRVSGVTVSGRKGKRDIDDIDAVAVSYGFQPNTELAELLGCLSVVDPTSWDRVLNADDYGRTSVPRVVIAGEVAGISGARNAMVEGSLAAHALAQDLGWIPRQSVPPRKLRNQHRKLDTFAQIARNQFPVQNELARDIPPETMVCRCEGVTAKEILSCASSNSTDINGVKGYTRAGMGICQGRQCGFAVAELVQGNAPAGAKPSLFSVRMPIKPIPLTAIQQNEDAS